MKILAIETSCDETSVAIVADNRVLVNKISSQIEVHKKWGGVVPGIAKRMHQENIDPVLRSALKQAKMSVADMDAIAVTYGPGLSIALEVGVTKAKELAVEFKKPLIAVNHMEGHIYSNIAQNSRGLPRVEFSFPFLAVLISGGHTELVLMQDHGKYEIVGRTLDDAIGEAYDKVARMLELGYPGGPMIEELAKVGYARRFPLPIPMIKNPGADFSYSGLKTAVMYLMKREIAPLKETLSVVEYRQVICDVAASFQSSAVASLLFKIDYALKKLQLEHEIHDIFVGGGVSANQYLRSKFRGHFGKRLRIHFPSDKKLIGDNAGMIGVAAYYKALRNDFADIDNLDRDPILSL
jgi:N6-L-threonylcarbamoyladenine synthase